MHRLTGNQYTGAWGGAPCTAAMTTWQGEEHALETSGRKSEPREAVVGRGRGFCRDFGGGFAGVIAAVRPSDEPAPTLVLCCIREQRGGAGFRLLGRSRSMTLALLWQLLGVEHCLGSAAPMNPLPDLTDFELQQSAYRASPRCDTSDLQKGIERRMLCRLSKLLRSRA